MHAPKSNSMNDNDLNNLELNTASTVELTGIIYNVPKEKDVLDKSPDKKIPTSDLEALLHVVKGCLGAGILAIAHGFKNSGLFVGVIGTLVVGFFSTHCTYIMVQCSQRMCQRLNRPYLGYTETTESVFLHCAYKRYQSLAPLMRALVEIFMFVTYYGTITAYIIIVAQSFQEILNDQFHWDVSIRCYILCVGVPIYFVGLVKNMKYLVPFSLIANVMLFFGLSLSFYYILTDLPPISSRPAYAPLSQFPSFFSTVLFGMEGIGAMFPIENSMKNPSHFLGCPGVLPIAMSIVVSLFTVVGFFGYLKFGNETKSSLTFNVPNNWLKGLVGMSIFFSYGLSLTACMDVSWKRLKEKVSPEKHNTANFLLRSFLIAGSLLLALALPKMDKVVELMGAIGFSMLGLFFPSLIETVFLYESGYGFMKWKLIKNIFFCLLAIFGLVAGSFNSTKDIIASFNE